MNVIPTEGGVGSPGKVTGNCDAPKFRPSARALHTLVTEPSLSRLPPPLILLEILTLLLTKYIASHPHSTLTILAVIHLKGNFMVWLLKAFGKE